MELCIHHWVKALDEEIPQGRCKQIKAPNSGQCMFFVYHAGSDAVFTMPEKNKYHTQTI